ncbi:MAG: aminopeptidase [bacterium]|nr:aminopeptidase [bacterium]
MPRWSSIAASRRPSGEVSSLFLAVAGFEWRYQMGSPMPWMGFALLFLMGFAITSSDQLQFASQGGVHINAPLAILNAMGIQTLFAAFALLAVFAGSILRDDDTRFGPLLQSSRLTRWSYLGGRFCGALAVSMGVLASIPLATAIASFMPWLDPVRLGAFQPGHYLWALLVMGLPTATSLGAIFFALAATTRSLMWSYLGALALLVAHSVTQSLMGTMHLETVAALADPFGLGALSLVTKYWTAAESNTRIPELAGLFLGNRLLWLGLGGGLLAATAATFRFEHRTGGRVSARATGPAVPPAAPAGGTLPGVRSDRMARWTQFLAIARHDAASVIRSPGFIVLLVIMVLMAGTTAWFVQNEYGTSSILVTRSMVQILTGSFPLMLIVIAIYHGGELVWRDRERRMHEIVDATPAPDWVHLVPKVGAIALVLLATLGTGILTGMGVQIAKGVPHLDPLAYLLWFGWPMAVFTLHMAVLSMLVQLLVPQKVTGWAVMVVYLVAFIALALVGFDHNLYIYAGAPAVPLSDMNGPSRFWIGQAWFHLYWSLFALLLGTVALAFWRRGNVGSLRQRLPLAWSRLRGANGRVALVSTVAFVAVGGFITWNTNVLNRYIPTPALEKETAEAEKTLLPFEKVPQPRIVAVTLKVDLFPREARAVTDGVYRVENRSGKRITELHLDMSSLLKLERLEFQGIRLENTFSKWGHRTYTLSEPLQPGQARELRFRTVLQERGFANSGPLTSIVDNGTFLNSEDITPFIGVNRRGFLTDRTKRRKYGLPEDLRPPTLEDVAGHDHAFIRGDSDWVTADLTIATDADQTLVAPGYVVSDRLDGSRRTVHFRPDAPIQHFFSIQSARYAIARDRLGQPDLAVYHHPDHATNVKRMLEAMKVSLDLYASTFSPFQFREARILEFPA